MSITISGTDYALVDGEYNLEVIFNRETAAGMNLSDKFESNVVAYHEKEAFKTFVQNAFQSGGQQNPQLLLVSLGGPQAISDLIKSARSAGIKGTRAGTARKTRAWQTSFAQTMTEIMYAAAKSFYDENKEEVWSKCEVPTEERAEDLANMLIKTGRGTLGYRVDQWEGVSPKTGDSGNFAINLNFRLDANNKGRAVRKESTNGVSATSPASEAHAK